MERDKQVNIRLTSERKRRWKEVAEDRERPLTQFIRWCVEQELSDESTGGSSSDQRSRQKLDTIIEEIQSLNASISDGPGSIAHRLSAIEGQLSDDPEARSLASTVYGLLPAESQVATLPELDDPAARVGENGRVVSGRPEHIAEYIRYSPDLDADPEPTQVQRALDDLQEDLRNVHRLNDGRYYRS